jgi:hypothetical protein
MTTTTVTPSRRAALGVLAGAGALALPAAVMAASTPAVAMPPALAAQPPTASAPTQEAPEASELVSLGQRIEQLARERETAESLQGDARARLENTTPKVRTRRLGSCEDESFAEIWDSLTNESHWKGFKRDPPMTMEQRWGCLCQLFEIKAAPAYTTIKADGERSGYASAKERVESIDVEIRDLASRALKIQAVTLAGAGAQAIALSSVRSIRPWLKDSCFDAGALTLSRTVKALSEAASV